MGINLRVGESEGGVCYATGWIEKGMMGRNRQIFMNMQHFPLYSFVSLKHCCFCRFCVLVTLYFTLFFCFSQHSDQNSWYALGKTIGFALHQPFFCNYWTGPAPCLQHSAWSDLMTQLLCRSLTEIKGNNLCAEVCREEERSAAWGRMRRRGLTFLRFCLDNVKEWQWQFLTLFGLSTCVRWLCIFGGCCMHLM